MNHSRQFAYKDMDPVHPGASQLPFLPLTLSHDSRQIALQGLLDTGATINVLPYSVGKDLGFVWERQTVALRLAGNLAQAPARAVVAFATVPGLPPARLAFAWTELDGIPLILGQTNFFLEFDVCFSRSQSLFEVRPRAA